MHPWGYLKLRGDTAPSSGSPRLRVLVNQTSGMPNKANLLTPVVVKESAVVIAGHQASPGKLVQKAFFKAR